MFISFKKLSSHRPEIKLEVSGTTVGSIVRWQRKRKNMTLHEGAEGICSISYLSKVENSLIEPSEKILENLKKRFDIETLIDYDIKRYDQHYDDIIKTIFNFKKVSSFYKDMYFDLEDFKSKLILYCYYIDHNNLDEAKSIFKFLEVEVSKFTQKEINLFFFMTALLLYKEGKYYLALEMLKLTNVVKDELLLSLLIENLYYNLQMLLEKYVDASKTLLELEQNLIKKQYFHRYQQLQSLKVVYNLKNFNYDEGLKKIQALKEASKNQKFVFTSFLQILHDKDINISKIENQQLNNIEFYILSLIYYDNIEDDEKIIKLIESSKTFLKTPLTEQLEFFLINKYQTDHEAFSRYVRHVTSNFKNNYNGIIIIKQLLNNAANFFEKQSYYKTANQLRKSTYLLSLNLKRSTEL